MKISASIEFIWQLAGQEAIVGKFEEIEPTHFYMALLKFSEFSVNDIVRISKGVEVTKLLTSELKEVREELDNHYIDSTKVRRKLRAQLGKGNSRYDGGLIHRSQSSRVLFNNASKLAHDSGSKVFTPFYLLDALMTSPPQIIEEVLGTTFEKKLHKGSKTPLLDMNGINITQLAVQGKLEPVTGRESECKILMQALTQINRPNVLLITDKDEVARSIVNSLAQTIKGPKCMDDMKNREIIDITHLNIYKNIDKETDVNIETIFDEAAEIKEIILFIPAIEAVKNTKLPNDWINVFKAMLARGVVQCICRTSEKAYEKYIQKDPDLKQSTHIMWVQEVREDEVPLEL